MDPDFGRTNRRLTIALVAFASAATEIAADDLRPIWQSVSISLVWLALAILANLFIPIPTDQTKKPPLWTFGLCAGLGGLPFLVEPFRRDLSGSGFPLEIQSVLAFRNLALGLAACVAWRRYMQLACVCSLFLMLFAAIMTTQVSSLPVLSLYCATGSIWLTAQYWQGLRIVFVANNSVLSLTVAEQRQTPVPKFMILCGVLILGVVVGLTTLGPREFLGRLGELMPTSGGTGGFDPFARSGVGDGDDETKGDNANSTGMTMSDTFLDTPLPSLYDLSNDMAGEPFKVTEQERSIALDPTKTKTRETKNRPADNLRPNREFPTSRAAPRKTRETADRSARALFEIEGRTPLHIRVAAYDGFDGNSWAEAPMASRQVILEKEENSNWITVVARQTPEIYRGTERHRWKLTAPEGSWIPTPTQMTRLHVEKLDQPSFFTWTQDRIMKFAERKTPSGIVLETDCSVIHPGELHRLNLFPKSDGDRLRYNEIPDGLSDELDQLVRAWTTGLPDGWAKIQSILDHLRKDYTLEVGSTQTAIPLRKFLFETKRGPDYLFATSAALLVRRLGYPTRFVSGFYASPDAYDRVTRHTPIVGEDLHFWAELQIPSGDWLTLEATPGYETLAPEKTFGERLTEFAESLGTWLWGNRIGVLITVGLFAIGWLSHRTILDRIAVYRWLIFQHANWRVGLQRVATILERRAKWAEKPRSIFVTRGSWMRAVAEGDESLLQLAELMEWATYAGDLPAPLSESQVFEVCREVLARWSIQHWKQRTEREGMAA